MPTVEQRVEKLTQTVEHNFDKVHKKLNALTEDSATLKERTKQHEKRMDRQDKKSVGIAAVTGVAGGGFGTFIKSLLTGGS
tara:strand:+ start:1261 stop:1503 length:243 start_codon:yes stop_codon:yes gene_type:complete